MSKLDEKRKAMKLLYCTEKTASMISRTKGMNPWEMIVAGGIYTGEVERITRIPWRLFYTNKPEIDKRRYKRWKRKMQFKGAKTVEIVTVKQPDLSTS